MLVGYARVSTEEQSISLQLDALRKAECERFFVDEGWSGCSSQRPALKKMLSTLEDGDQLVVWKLDRLSRSLSDLLEMVKMLEKQGVDLLSISESIDTKSPGGLLVFHIMGAMAQFERALISERTKAGMYIARKNGIRLGRPAALTDEQSRRAIALAQSGQHISGIARRFGVSRGTIYRVLKNADQMSN